VSLPPLNWPNCSAFSAFPEIRTHRRYGPYKNRDLKFISFRLERHRTKASGIVFKGCATKTKHATTAATSTTSNYRGRSCKPSHHWQRQGQRQGNDIEGEDHPQSAKLIDWLIFPGKSVR